MRVLPIFELIAERGGVSERDMFSTFNMGVGMVIAVAPESVEAVMAAVQGEGCEPYVLGEVVAREAGSEGVELW